MRRTRGENAVETGFRAEITNLLLLALCSVLEFRHYVSESLERTNRCSRDNAKSGVADVSGNSVTSARKPVPDTWIHNLVRGGIPPVLQYQVPRSLYIGRP